MGRNTNLQLREDAIDFRLRVLPEGLDVDVGGWEVTLFRREVLC